MLSNKKGDVMRYLMTFSYDGTNYSGYQIQKNKRTIQEEIEKVLKKINHDKEIKIYSSGRTDAHVHALNQKAHFDFEQFDVENLKYKMNKMLPNDIYIKKIEEVDNNFHARFSDKIKEYMYKINTLEYNPFEANYIYQYNNHLNIEKMKEAIVYFIGEHDFTSFTASKGKKEDMVRTIYDATIEEKEGIIEIKFKGNGFLQYMVRNMVGFLIEIGEGKKEPAEVEKVLNLKNRIYASKTFSPVGLYLSDVLYVKNS